MTGVFIRRLGHRHTEKRPCADTGRRWFLISQGERPAEKTNPAELRNKILLLKIAGLCYFVMVDGAN